MLDFNAQLKAQSAAQAPAASGLVPGIGAA
jgi:hypothetical protein